MKISMMTYTLARQLKSGEPFDLKGCCVLSRELGIDGVDWCGLYGYTPHEIRKMTDSYGLKNICYTCFPDLNFPNPDERAPGLEFFQQSLEVAQMLGAELLMIPVQGKSKFSREQSFRNVVAGLRTAVPMAAQAGITVSVEHFPEELAPFVVSADVNRAIAELPDLRVTYDNGNVTTGGESTYNGFKNSARHIVHAHFKDFSLCPADDPLARRCLDGKFRCPELVGDGAVDQLGALRAMQECGYSGYINFEYEGNKYPAAQACRIGVARMREMMTRL
jgi:L-ribulose-5-phosphate 3-epimerase